MNAQQQKAMNDRLYNPNRSIHGGQRHPTPPFTGIVVSADDPLEMGRLRVYVPALRDDPRNPESIAWAMYMSPYAGVIDNPQMLRGPEGSKETTGRVPYGMWAIPEVGAEVLVMFVNGDPNARVWMGCIPNHQQMNAWGHGRYVWAEDAYGDGPYSGGAKIGNATTHDETDKIQPTYDNLDRAFNGEKTSPEWMSRGADRQALANPSLTEFTTTRDQRYGEIQKILYSRRGAGAQLAKHNATIVSNPGYGWSGQRYSLGKSSRVSRVYGMSTPGFHSFTMDDRHGNCRIRVRTTGGSQILLDDTNERMYFSVGRGNAWHEMDWNGNIDIFSGRRFNVHAIEDINFTSEGTIRMLGRRGIHMVAGTSDLAAADQNLPAVLPDGQIRLHAMDDMHLFTDKNLLTYSVQETRVEAAEAMHWRTGDSLHSWAKTDTHIYSSKGDIVSTAGGNIFSTATKDFTAFATGSASVTALMNAGISAMTGRLDMSAGAGTLIKIMGGDFQMQAVDGTMSFQSPATNFEFGKNGIRGATTGQVLLQGENFEARSMPTSPPSQSPADAPPDPGVDCEAGSGPLPYIESNVTSTTYNGRQYQWYSGVDNIARACYNAGFRGSDLVTMVAIMGQESRFGKNTIGPATTDSGKSTKNDPIWLPNCLGPFQMRCYREPDKYGSASTIEGGRRPSVAFDTDAVAKWSYRLKNQRGFNQWSGYTDGNYKKFIAEAEAAVTRICGSNYTSAGSTVQVAGDGNNGATAGTPTLTGGSMTQIQPEQLNAPPLPDLQLDVEALSSTVSAIKVNGDTVRVQGVNDVMLKTAVDNVGTSLQCLRYKMDDQIMTYNRSVQQAFDYIHDVGDNFRGMILSMAQSLVTGLAQAANEVTPTAAIAAMTQVVNDINNVVNLLTQVQSSIDAFTDFPQTIVSGVERLAQIPDLDMNLSTFIPPEFNTLQRELEQAYYELRTAGTSLEAANRAVGTLGDILGVDTTDSPGTPPGDC